MNDKDLNQLNPQEFLLVKNVHQNNLKNLNLAIPHRKIIVVTGVSGSGKSSLAFETLYEEGRRRYVESLSSYVRQFLGKIKKPKVDFIKGLPPAIAIEQKKSTSNSRSTVGTVTEIYHYLKLFYARIGKTYSPISGKEVKRDNIDDIVDSICRKKDGSKIKILSLIKCENGRRWHEELSILLQKGFSRLLINNEISKVEDILEEIEKKERVKKIEKELDKNAFILIDRIVLKKNDNENINRISDSVQTAVYEGKGKCIVNINSESFTFSNEFERDGISFEEPSPDLFSFNSPYGACPRCGGFGEILGIDEDKVIPNKQISVYDGAVICWEGEKMRKWKMAFIKKAKDFDFPIFTPYNELSQNQIELLWEGNASIKGIDDFFKFIESKSYKIHYRIFISRYKGKSNCNKCHGTRLRKEADYVKIENKSIGELVKMPLSELKKFFEKYANDNKDNKIAKRILFEINNRLQMIEDIGLGYLDLNRTSRSLSGGELQRIQIIYSIGSNLSGSLYILDEPSIGLHPKDTDQLIKILKHLKSLGNTIIVVEHDENIIKAADEIIDLGPSAGADGGYLVFQANHKQLAKESKSLTAKYLNGKLEIKIPEKYREPKYSISFKNAQKFNLKNIDINIPLFAFTVITGVSGSGKTTLVKEVILKSLKNIETSINPMPVNCQEISGSTKYLKKIEFVDQNSIDRSKRSNPATYLKVFDNIRELFASQQISKIRGYKASFFSFNVEGGRCEECKGEGKITIEMQFVADMHLVCDECKGKRYKDEILEVKYNDKNIDQVLNLTIKETIEFFSEHKSIKFGLQPLAQVGLDYLKLGQPTSTLSGGEAQRLKLASFIAKGSKTDESTLFIFDEPTTGLHWHDIRKLLDSFNALIEKGHTVLVIEHNLEVIKCADHIIDLGKEGGEKGGDIIYQGNVNGLLGVDDSYTAKYLKDKLGV